MTKEQIDTLVEKESPFLVLGDLSNTFWHFKSGQLTIGDHYISDYKIEVGEYGVFVQSDIILGSPINYLIYLPSLSKEVILNYDKPKVNFRLSTKTSDTDKNSQLKLKGGMFVLISKKRHPAYQKEQ